MVTRHKPRKEVKDATHPASEADYEKLAAAVVRAIILKQRDVVLKFAYFIQFPEGFPKGILEHKDEQYNYYRAKSFRLADWLYSIGKLPTDAKGVVRSTRELVYKMAHINKLLDGNSSVWDNSVSEVVEEHKEDNNGTNSCDDEEGC